MVEFPSAPFSEYEIRARCLINTAYNRAVAELDASLSTWLEAIRTFEDVLGSMATADVDDYGSLISRLEEAWEGYQHVGDDGMAERVGKFIAHFLDSFLNEEKWSELHSSGKSS